MKTRERLVEAAISIVQAEGEVAIRKRAAEVAVGYAATAKTIAAVSTPDDFQFGMRRLMTASAERASDNDSARRSFGTKGLG